MLTQDELSMVAQLDHSTGHIASDQITTQPIESEIDQ